MRLKRVGVEKNRAEEIEGGGKDGAESGGERRLERRKNGGGVCGENVRQRKEEAKDMPDTKLPWRNATSFSSSV